MQNFHDSVERWRRIVKDLESHGGEYRERLPCGYCNEFAVPDESSCEKDCPLEPKHCEANAGSSTFNRFNQTLIRDKKLDLAKTLLRVILTQKAYFYEDKKKRKMKK